MNKRTILSCGLLVATWLAVSLGAAQAQATRTWVSGVGDDANPCSRTAPCKTFAGAISKTAANGEISVLDPGGFGVVTITKSISIVADGVEGGILAAASNGIIINAGVNDVVNISGLVIEGAGTGLNGIRILSARAVHIRKTVIRGFVGGTGTAIDIQALPQLNVTVSDSTLNRNLTGILAKPTSTNTTRVLLDNVMIDNHPTAAITSDGAKSIVRLSNSTIFQTNTAFNLLNGGQLESYGNNSVSGSGTPTAILPLR